MRSLNAGRAGLIGAVVLLALATSARAETLVYEVDDAPLFSIEIPEGWLVDLDFAQEAREAGVEEPRFRVAEISPGDDSHVWMGVWALPDAESLERAETYLRSLRQDLFTDVVMSDPAETTINGMRARSSKGTAKKDGAVVELAVTLFEPRPGAIVAALYVGEVDAWRIHSAALEAMIASLQPVTP